MGWLQILENLAQAVMQSESPSSNPLGVSGPSRTTRSLGATMVGEPSRVTVIPPDPNEEVRRAEAETRRMLEETYHEMIDERVDYGVQLMAERVEQASARVIDIETHVNSRLDAISNSVNDVQFQTRNLERLQKKVDLLLGTTLALLALCAYLLYLSLGA
jgi:hypothetical protein